MRNERWKKKTKIADSAVRCESSSLSPHIPQYLTLLPLQTYFVCMLGLV